MILRTYRAAYAGLPRDVWLLSAVALVNRAGTMVLPFLALWLTQERGFSVAEATRFLALYGLGSIGGSMLGGHLTDRIGPRVVQATSLASGGVVLLVLGACESAGAIGGAAFLLALLGDAFRPANATLLTAVSPPDRRGRAFALNRLAVNLGMAIGPALGGFLALIGYGWLFVVDGVTCILAALLFLRFFGGRAAVTKAARDGDASDDGSPWRDGVFLACIGLSLVVATIFLQAMSTMPLYLRDAYHLREDRIGLLFAINPILITLFEMILVHRLERPNPLRITGIAALLIGAGFALLPYGATFAFGAFAVVVWTIGEMLDAPLLGGFIANRASARHRGRYMAMYTMIFSASMVLAPEIGGHVYERFGPTTLWRGCGVAGLLVCIGFMLVARRVDAERAK